jgi:TRAP-type mannitol/chloroaromatic compound transport system substrate-binding protein
MKRIYLPVVVLVVLTLILLSGCGEGAKTVTQTQTTTQVSTSVTTSATTVTGKVFKWKLEAPDPSMGFTNTDSKQYVTDAVRTVTNGRLDISFFNGEQLVPEAQLMEACQKGTVQMIQTVGALHSGIWKAGNLEFAIPFNPRTQSQIDQFFYTRGGLDWLRQKYAEKFNVYYLGYLQEPGFTIMSKKPLNGVDDLKGLKIRMSGLLLETFKLAGAAPVRLPPTDIYMSLSQGVIDAATWGTPVDNTALKLQEIAKNYVNYNMEPGLIVQVLVNMDAWNSLSPDLQQALQLGIQVANVENQRKYAEADAKEAQVMKDAGVKFITWPDSEWAKMRQFAKQALDNFSAGDADCLAFLDMYNKQLKDLGY